MIFVFLQLSLTGGVFSIDGKQGRIEYACDSLPESIEEKEKVWWYTYTGTVDYWLKARN